jgi:ssDNA-specific exonuclease RecJ
MTDKPAKPAKRRSVSKARLYKELEAAVETHQMTTGQTIKELMDAIKDDIVTEALK